MYPRIISVSRPNQVVTVGAQGYSGTQPVGETILFEGIPAEIQLSRKLGRPEPDLPSDTISIPGFQIFVQPQWLKLGDVNERDIITDDLGKRYQVIGAYWNVLGYNLTTSLLVT